MSAPEPLIEIVGEAYDPDRFAHRVDRGAAGAVVTFTGLCRSEDGRLRALELEHHPTMAHRQIRRIAATCIGAHDLLAMGVIHRHGLVAVGEPIVTVVAAARHRQEAFDGANRLMDFLKTDAPFWKKEHPVDGSPGAWVAAAARDDRARGRWSG